jgi:hypothetical protein
MPCDTVQISSVNLELKAENKTFLIAALKSLRYQVRELANGTVTFRTPEGIDAIFTNGKLTLNSYGTAAQNFNVNPIKKAYSVEVVKASAKKFGWNLQQDKQSQFKFIAQKRGL